MLSSVLSSPTAIRVNIQIIRVFTKIRQVLTDSMSMKLEIEEIKKKLTEFGLRSEIGNFGFAWDSETARLKNLKVYNQQTGQLIATNNSVRGVTCADPAIVKTCLGNATSTGSFLTTTCP